MLDLRDQLSVAPQKAMSGPGSGDSPPNGNGGGPKAKAPSPNAITFSETEEASAIRRALALPDLIDKRYRVIARLGAGAMGVVLRAEDLFLQRPVAIKVVEPDRMVLERFMKEAQALAQVRHENVVQVYAFGPLQQSYYLAMELVVGQPLDSIIDAYTQAGETMPLERAMSILGAISQGLAAVHARQLIHRDVKPGNIILEKGTDRPVLIDFGLARRRTKSNPKLSISGGTPSYMAPEQARDPDGTRVTTRTDLYAFACTAFEMLTGRPVFEGEDIYTVLIAHMNQDPRRLSSLRPELAPIDEVIQRGLAKDPDQRYASVPEMMSAIEAGFARIAGQTSVLTSKVVPKPAGATDEPCALILASEPGLRRSIQRNATNWLKTRAVAMGCESVETASEAITFLSSTTQRCNLVIVDEESTAGRLAEIALLLRNRNPNAEIVIISRDLPATQNALANVGTRIRHLVPKPVNTHVLTAVLGRLDLTNLR